jgi:cation:H+ antiporter
MIVGFFSLFIGAHILVHSTIRICQIMGVPHYVMGASAVAVFTSLPELVTSVVATYRGHVDVCVGNVLGSNLINTLLILGAVSLFRPLSVSEGIGRVGFPALFLCCSLFLLVSKRGGIRKKEGFLLLAFYTFFLLWLFGILK